MESNLRERLRALPKAELHLHLEGCVRPQLLLELSTRHGYPFGLRDLSSCRSLYEFSDFPGFIRAIKTASQHLIDPRDYAAVVLDLARYLQEQGVVYAEVFLSIGILLWRQSREALEIEAYWRSIEEARLNAESETGVRMRWLFDAVRQFGASHLEAVIDWAIRLQDSGSVLGIGIGGDERIGPAVWFQAGFNRAREAGLHLTAHAGESTDSAAVQRTLDQLRPARIGHGLHACDDSAVVEGLATSPVYLDVCTTSNWKTGCWDPKRPHPLGQFWKRGVKLSLSSDDPAMFGTTLLDEYEFAHDRCGLTWNDIVELVRSSFRGSFLSAQEKEVWLARLA